MSSKCKFTDRWQGLGQGEEDLPGDRNVLEMGGGEDARHCMPIHTLRRLCPLIPPREARGGKISSSSYRPSPPLSGNAGWPGPLHPPQQGLSPQGLPWALPWGGPALARRFQSSTSPGSGSAWPASWVPTSGGYTSQMLLNSPVDRKALLTLGLQTT